MKFVSLLLIASLIAAPGFAQSQGTPVKTPPTKKAPVTKAAAQPPQRTTLSGVYTLDEARAGKEMYAGLCANCHTAATHTGPTFRTKWAGRPLSDLFSFMRTEMPKNDPASLADEDYGVLLAYMLQMNQMPAGKMSLSTDSVELAKIRIDTTKTVNKK